MRNLFYKFSKQCKLSFLILMLFALSPLNGNAAVVVNSASELLSYLLSISQNSAEIFDGKVVVNWNISVPDMIKIPLGSNITIESRRHLNATIEVDGGTLSFVGDNAYGSSLCNVILQSGTLKLQKASSDPCISTATVNGGNIQQEGGGTVGATLVQELIINAEASIKGCLERSSISYPLCKKMLVAASANNVSIQDSYISEYLEISGDATLNNVCCDETLINSGTVSIQNFYGARIGHGTITQKGGTVSMYDVFSLVLVEGGELTIDSTPWLNTGKDLKDQTCSPVVHLKGDNAKVLFMNGTHFDGNAINALGGYAVRLTKGELEIRDGFFENTIYVEGGKLSVTGGHFKCSTNSIHREGFYIAKPAQVSFSGGYFGDGLSGYGDNVNPIAFFLAEASRMKPKDLLAPGYSFYTHHANFQPDLLLEGDDIPTYFGNFSSGSGTNVYIGAVKPSNKATDVNSWYEAARLADVGPTGTDIEIKDNCYLIKTPVGLAWISLISNCMDRGVYSPTDELVYYWLAKDNPYLPTYIYNDPKSVKCFALANDLDMSDYKGQKVDWAWNPFNLHNHSFDGRGHTISNLNVRQHSPSFIGSITSDPGMNATLSNLRLQGTMIVIADDYYIEASYAAGLVLKNSGTIVNCSFEGSILSNSLVSSSIGGLVYWNYDNGKIMNSYMVGTIDGRKTAIGADHPSSSEAYYLEAGGLACYNGGLISNCYHKGDVSYINETNCQDFQIYTGYIIAKDFGGSTLNCYDKAVDIEIMNRNVTDYNKDCTVLKWIWTDWKKDRNGGYVHDYKDKPSVIETQFALLVKGEGALSATYAVLGDKPNDKPEIRTINADTTVNISNVNEFTVTATPAKGATLMKVTRILDNQPELELENIKPGEAFKYDVSFLSATLIAYFQTDTVIPEDGDTVEGETNAPIDISGVGSEEKDAMIYFENVDISIDNSKNALTISDDSKVVLQISGTNKLGNLVNNGKTSIEVMVGESANLVDTKVVNNGIFTDKTSFITEVTGKAALSVTPREQVLVEPEGGKISMIFDSKDADESELSYFWQRLENDKWIPEKPEFKAFLLKPTSILRADWMNTEKEITINPGEDGKYRCWITREKEGVVTTLVTTTAVKFRSSVADITYYNLTLPSIEGAILSPSAGTYSVEEGGSFSFSLTLEADYNQSTPIVKVGDKVIEPASDGKYEIKGIASDITISITGIMKNATVGNAEIESNTLKIWGSNGVLHIQSDHVSTAYIMTFGGQLYKALTLPIGETMITIPQGSYIIRIENQSYKIRF